MTPNPSAILQTLAALRGQMQRYKLDYYLVGSSDPHSSEHPPQHWRYLPEVSGFEGSLGYLLVSQDFAGLWVDSRYHVLAERQCPKEIQVFRQGKTSVPELHHYWQQCLASASRPSRPSRSSAPLRLGFDESCFARSSLRKLLAVCAGPDCQLDGSSLSLDCKALWPALRPPLPQTPVYSYSTQYCGQGRQDKLCAVRQQMQDQGWDYYPIALLDNIAWLLNIRASDIKHHPLAISFVLLGQQSLRWYIDKQRLGAELLTELHNELPELEIVDYQTFYTDCQQLAQQSEQPRRFLLSERCNMRLLRILSAAEQPPGQGSAASTPSGRDIITDIKAVKNPVEQEQLRRVMTLDGAAMVAFHHWLRPLPQQGQAEQAGKLTLDEYQAGQKLTEFRRQVSGELGRGESFDPIVGFGANSALPHYSAPPPTEGGGSRALARRGGWLLVDSGGQYLGGTTDMTRCFSLEADFAPPRFAEPERIQQLRLAYTLVLKGHLRLQYCRFPSSTLGVQLDALARNDLWQEGLDYLHGTGHGVGSFLSVHEGPAIISPSPLNEPLRPGMLISNEPGYYCEGAFGIRIENLLLVQVDSQRPGWLYFETASLFPYERELILLDRLSPCERQWIDQYHANCLQGLAACGKLDKQQQAWLAARCAPLD